MLALFGMTSPKGYLPHSALDAVLGILRVPVSEIATHKDIAEQCAAIRESCSENSAEQLESFIQELGAPSCSTGAEHIVYRYRKAALAIKVTKLGTYGHATIGGTGNGTGIGSGTGKATPLAYLWRLALHNEYFGSDLRLLGCRSSKQIVISQPWIEKTEPSSKLSQEQISAYMKECGLFESALPRGDYGGRVYTNAPKTPLLVFYDVNPENVWLARSGNAIAMDVVIGEPPPDDVRRLMNEGAGRGPGSVDGKPG